MLGVKRRCRWQAVQVWDTARHNNVMLRRPNFPESACFFGFPQPLTQNKLLFFFLEGRERHCTVGLCRGRFRRMSKGGLFGSWGLGKWIP